MELSWTTFILEVINFLVLVFILQRFFYKPVMGVLEARQKHVQEALSQADSTKAEAETLKLQFEGRLHEWEKERESARQQLLSEIESERTRQLTKLREDLSKEREKAEVRARRDAEQASERLETRAVQQGAAFASKLLAGIADEHVEQRLADLAAEQIAEMPDDQSESIRAARAKLDGSVHIASVNPLGAEQKGALENALEKVLGERVPCEYEQDPSLVAGVRLTVGSWTFDANVAGELSAFVQSSHD